MTRGEAIKDFFYKTILPVAAAVLLYCIFRYAGHTGDKTFIPRIRYIVLCRWFSRPQFVVAIVGRGQKIAVAGHQCAERRTARFKFCRGSGIHHTALIQHHNPAG